MPLKNDKELPFGHLNPVSSQYSPGKAEMNLNVFSFFQSLKELVKDKYSTDSLAGNTEYKAIVLKVLSDTEFGGAPQLSSIDGVKPDLIRIIAKIPELHAHLPNPRGEKDYEILGMYTIFEGSKELSAPKAGDIVRVTYQNIYNQTGPIYLGPVAGGTSISGLVYDSSNSAKDVHQNGSDAQSLPNNSIGQQNIENPGFESDDRNGAIINQIILHESVTATSAGAVRTLDGDHNSVHFIIDIDGTETQTLDLIKAGRHAGLPNGPTNSYNKTSIGIEVINQYKPSSDSDPKRVFPKETSNRIPWAAGGRYLLPPQVQLEAVWKLLKRLTSGNVAGIPSSQYGLKMIFPATSIKANIGYFTWGAIGPMALNGKTGIFSHARQGLHTDGGAVEFYCFCRYLGYHVNGAYSKTMEAINKTATDNTKKTQIERANISKEAKPLIQGLFGIKIQ